MEDWLRFNTPVMFVACILIWALAIFSMFFIHRLKIRWYFVIAAAGFSLFYVGIWIPLFGI